MEAIMIDAKIMFQLYHFASIFSKSEVASHQIKVKSEETDAHYEDIITK